VVVVVVVIIKAPAIRKCKEYNKCNTYCTANVKGISQNVVTNVNWAIGAMHGYTSRHARFEDSKAVKVRSRFSGF
jgi:hypothetical protein